MLQQAPRRPPGRRFELGRGRWLGLQTAVLSLSSRDGEIPEVLLG